MAESILKIANDVVLDTDGVSSIAFPGIIPVPTDRGIQFEIYVNIAYGKFIPEIAWNIQERIKKVFDENEYKIAKINIHIEGVEVSKEE